MSEINTTNEINNENNDNSDHCFSIFSSIPSALMNSMMSSQSQNNTDNSLENLNKKSHSPTLYRDGILEQLMTVLIGEAHPNALLVGPAGTGKTKIVEELAHRIETNDLSVPELLKGYTIYSLQISDLVAGSNIVGALEEKVNALIDFLSDEKNKAILFLDEFHMLFKSDMYEKIAQILKPALSRGTIRVIGATTTQEVKTIDTDPAFKRRFTKVIVDELSKEQTLKIVNSYVKKLTDHYNMPICYNEDLGMEIVNIADEYCSHDSHRPDNAVTLLDRTVASTIVENYKNDIPKNMMSEIKLSKKIIIKTAMKIATGHNEPKDFSAEELREELRCIKGQDHIIDEIVSAINLRNMHIRPMIKPLTFLFAGSSGVGKTEVSKILAKYCTEEKPIILNMTEFISAPSINRLIGAPAGYVGFDSNAEMPFDILDTNPYQVIVLDEFDKAHKSVQNLFMSVFDEGYMINSYGKTIDFSKSIIIATTNAGYMNINNPIGINKKKNKNVSISDLSEYFDVALINRFNHKISFSEITKDIYKDIMRETYMNEVKEIKMLQSDISLEDELSEQELIMLCDKSFDIRMGARPIKTALQEYIDNRLLEGYA